MVVDHDLEGLSTELGVSWKPLARRLEFGEAEIEGFDHDNKELREKCYRMLHTWKRKKASSAAYLVLYEALCHEHVGRKDLAVKYCISESTDEEESTSEGWTWMYDKDYFKRQTWICTIWPIFSLNCRLLFITST